MVGPFATRQDAEAHVAWCRDVRNDGTTMEVVSQFIAERLNPMMKLTPAEDLAQQV